ncbi:fungal-specific transcription factor domain-containing protein [Penicillium argentinense]|uniref:Fungal-specific transcription factor domain-containing protein n=1 Tax=Penicillium argentinense TaxID=1131581 RepID=A0A9W9KAE1_9EURO|nr:fungal-specific transcription factor domain-containing protein [Penicillium argentinense]KAJ5098925.1 fungal-specific transcription factor domain-containing protein [Penicillium argentinense]
MSTRSDINMGLLMGYMDYVFPALFPFYNPSILEGGRSWLPILATTNSGFGNSIISLTSYFFSIVPVVPGLDHDKCSTKTWEEVRNQIELALNNVQHDVAIWQSRGTDTSLRDGVNLLATIVQLLHIAPEIFTSCQWQVHLKAAVALFQQMLKHHGQSSVMSGQGIEVIMKDLVGGAPFITPVVERGAFSFFSSLLIMDDIIASTCLEKPSELLPLLHDLQTSSPKADPPRRLEEITGCQDWVFLVIGEVAAFDAWEKENERTGRESSFDLIPHIDVHTIEVRWQEGMKRLYLHQQYESSSPADIKSTRPLEYILRNSDCTYGLRWCSSETRYTITSVWAQAARVYTLSVFHGWWARESQISNCVEETLKHLDRITSPAQLRTLVWPICVTGCLAREEQRTKLLSILSKTGALGALRSVREALEIIQKVWGQQPDDGYTWDVASCLRCLGHRVLLV